MNASLDRAPSFSSARFLGLGLAVWLIGTLAFRWLGQALLNPTQPALLVGVFGIGGLLMFFAVRALLRPLRSSERLRASVLFILPGMLLDTFATAFFPSFYPNIAPEADRLSGALMLWGYSFALLPALLERGQRA